MVDVNDIEVDTLTLWHQQLGHLLVQGSLDLRQKEMVITLNSLDTNLDLRICESYLLDKKHGNAFESID